MESKPSAPCPKGTTNESESKAGDLLLSYEGKPVSKMERWKAKMERVDQISFRSLLKSRDDLIDFESSVLPRPDREGAVNRPVKPHPSNIMDALPPSPQETTSGRDQGPAAIQEQSKSPTHTSDVRPKEGLATLDRDKPPKQTSHTLPGRSSEPIDVKTHKTRHASQKHSASRRSKKRVDKEPAVSAFAKPEKTMPERASKNTSKRGKVTELWKPADKPSHSPFAKSNIKKIDWELLPEPQAPATVDADLMSFAGKVTSEWLPQSSPQDKWLPQSSPQDNHQTETTVPTQVGSYHTEPAPDTVNDRHGPITHSTFTDHPKTTRTEDAEPAATSTSGKGLNSAEEAKKKARSTTSATTSVQPHGYFVSAELLESLALQCSKRSPYTSGSYDKGEIEKKTVLSTETGWFRRGTKPNPEAEPFDPKFFEYIPPSQMKSEVTTSRTVAPPGEDNKKLETSGNTGTLDAQAALVTARSTPVLQPDTKQVESTGDSAIVVAQAPPGETLTAPLPGPDTSKVEASTKISGVDSQASDIFVDDSDLYTVSPRYLARKKKPLSNTVVPSDNTGSKITTTTTDSDPLAIAPPATASASTASITGQSPTEHQHTSSAAQPIDKIIDFALPSPVLAVVDPSTEGIPPIATPELQQGVQGIHEVDFAYKSATATPEPLDLNNPGQIPSGAHTPSDKQLAIPSSPRKPQGPSIHEHSSTSPHSDKPESTTSKENTPFARPQATSTFPAHHVATAYAHPDWQDSEKKPSRVSETGSKPTLKATLPDWLRKNLDLGPGPGYKAGNVPASPSSPVISGSAPAPSSGPASIARSASASIPRSATVSPKTPTASLKTPTSGGYGQGQDRLEDPFVESPAYRANFRRGPLRRSSTLRVWEASAIGEKDVEEEEGKGE